MQGSMKPQASRRGAKHAHLRALKRFGCQDAAASAAKVGPDLAAKAIALWLCIATTGSRARCSCPRRQVARPTDANETLYHA